MKELTFREVIANIKEGEVWESREKIIKCTEVSILIESKDGVAYKGFGFLDQTFYRLQRPQYTFQEAFKALEEGKEIENEEGDKYKKKNNKVVYTCRDTIECRFDIEDEVFSVEEIKGKWYINN